MSGKQANVMRKYFYVVLLILVILVIVVITGNNGKTRNAIKETNPQNLETAHLEFEGMDCPSCALGIEYELRQVNGVVNAKVKYPEGTGTVTFNPDVVDAETIAKASTVYPARVVGGK